MRGTACAALEILSMDFCTTCHCIYRSLVLLDAKRNVSLQLPNILRSGLIRSAGSIVKWSVRVSAMDLFKVHLYESLSSSIRPINLSGDDGAVTGLKQ